MHAASSKTAKLQVEQIPMLQTVKQLIEGGVKQLSPSFYWHAKTKRVGRRIENLNPEFSVLLSLCDEEQIAIDIGAARGEMTLLLLEHSQACYAFEPCRAHSVFLRRHFRDYRKPVFIEEVALSIAPVTQSYGNSGTSPVKAPLSRKTRKLTEQ